MKIIKSKKLRWLAILFFVGSALFLHFWNFRWPTAVLELAGQELEVLVARSPNHQYKGLGGRDSLEPYDGMLFVFSFPRQVGIVMRDMRFPIDIVWIEKGVVVDIAPYVQVEPGVPEGQLRVYRPRVPAKYVLELPAGWAEEYELKIGDRLRVLEE